MTQTRISLSNFTIRMPRTFLVFLALSYLALKCANSQFVTVYQRPSFQGPPLNLTISTCVQSLPKDFENRVLSINTRSHCVQLYEGFNCSGKYLVMKPGVQHDNLNGYRRGLEVKSLGPCHPKCHPENIVATPPEGGVVIHVARLRSSVEVGMLASTNITLRGRDCSDVFEEFFKVQSKTATAVITSPTSHCVEAHQLHGCNGPSYRLYLGPGATNHKLFGYSLRLDQFKSFSLCGSTCKDGGSVTHQDETNLHAQFLCGTSGLPEHCQNLHFVPVAAYNNGSHSQEITNNNESLAYVMVFASLFVVLVAACAAVVVIIIYRRSRPMMSSAHQGRNNSSQADATWIYEEIE